MQDEMKTFAEIDIQFESTEYIILIHNSILQEIYEILRLLILLFSLSSEFVVFIRATEKYKPRSKKRNWEISEQNLRIYIQKQFLRAGWLATVNLEEILVNFWR